MIIELTELTFDNNKTEERKIWIRSEMVTIVTALAWKHGREDDEAIHGSSIATISGRSVHVKEPPEAFVRKL